MTPTPTELRLQQVVSQKLKIDPSEVPLDRGLMEDLGLDSLDVVEVILEIEQHFQPVAIWGQSSAEELTTLREVASYIDNELARQ